MSRYEELTPDEAEVRAIWDALIAGEPLVSDESDETAATIKEFHALDSAPELSPALRDSIWQSVQAALPPAAAFSTNGHHQAVVDSLPVSPGIEPETKRASVLQRSARIFRLLSIGVMAGAIAGAIAGGLGSRVAMRIAGSLSEGAARTIETQDGNSVGSMSVGGTISLMVFAAIVGVAGGILYLPFRSLVPGLARKRGLIYGASLLFIFGFVIMDKSNPDYRTFGSPAINVGTFSACYLLFGVIVAPVAEWMNRVLPAWPLERRIHWKNAPGHGLILLFGMIGCLALLVMILGGGGLALISLLVSLGCGFVARLYETLIKGRTMRWREISPFVRNAMIGGPALAGLAITLRSVASILGLG